MIEVAIVGAGPAGSYCAYFLAKNGISTVMFDYSHPREKPCGGLIVPFAQRLFPFLENLPIKHGKRSKMYFILPSGRRVCLSTRKKILCLSRLEFDQYLMNMALNKGTKLIKEKVVALERKENFWKVKTSDGIYKAKILIGADGVNSLVRSNIIGPLGNMDKGVCCGYFVKGLEDEDITLRFLVHRKGYMWIIPRHNHTSLGIGASEASRSSGLRKELDLYIKHNYADVEKLSRWTALIPNIKNYKTLMNPVSGTNWLLIGDAAGHVNPISGEGILYALLDGELAGQAVLEKKPWLFHKLWREAYGRSLFMDINFRKCVYTSLGMELYSTFLKFSNILKQ